MVGLQKVRGRDSEEASFAVAHLLCLETPSLGEVLRPPFVTVRHCTPSGMALFLPEIPLLLPKQKPTFSCLALGRAASYIPSPTEQPFSDLKAEVTPAHPRLLSRLPRTMFVWSPRSHTWRSAQLGGANPPVGSEAFSGPTPGLWLLSHHPPLRPHHLQSCRNAAVPGTPSQLSSETLFSEAWHPTPDPPSQEISREKQNPNTGTFSYCITRRQE